MVWLTWIGVPLLAVLAGLRTGLVAGLALGIVAGLVLGIVAGLAVLGIGVVAQMLYLRWFPHISGWMGYGSVADTPAESGSLANPPPHVTLYTASVCPFCPIIRRRLAELQRDSKFEVQEIDVTFRPELVRAKGLRSVPVLEANGQFLVGNATSAQISKFLKAPGTVRDMTG
jgi:glutaredoxin